MNIILKAGRSIGVWRESCAARFNSLPKTRQSAIIWNVALLAAMAVTSRDALDNLLRLFATIADIVLATPVFASHPRIAEHARLRGFRTVLSCEPGDQAMVREMAVFFSRH